MPDRSRPTTLRSYVLARTLVVGLAPLIVLVPVMLLSLRGLDAAAERDLASTRQNVLDHAATALRSEAEMTSREIDLTIGAMLSEVVDWSRQPAVVVGAETAGTGADASLPGELERFDQLVSIGVTDRSGHYAGWAGRGIPTPQVVQSAEPWWRGAWESGVHIGDLVLDPASGRYVVPIASRIENSGGEWVGVVSASLDVGAIQAIADLRAAEGVEISVVTAGGQLLAETGSGHDPSRIGATEPGPGQRSAGVEQALAGTTGTLVAGGTAYASTGVEWSRAVDGPSARRAGPEWLVVAAEPSHAALAPLADLDALSEDIGGAGRELLAVALLAFLLAVAVAGAVAAALSHQIADPIRRLTLQARRLAETGLEPGTAFDIRSGQQIDELYELARSLDSAQKTAARQTLAHVSRRLTITELLANLGRRNQSLVKRQLRLIDELERSEDDPDRLASMFELDHLAARMRRNAESLLVVTDQRPQLRRSAPVRIELVVHDALAEIEHFERVSCSRLEPVAITGRAVGDLAHLLAELAENALASSPPETSVAVTGASDHDRYRISVIDRGIGMSSHELAAANDRLVAAGGSDIASPTQLGLLVVARLAARHGIEVRLERADGGGTAARVTIPHELLEPADLATGLPQPSATTTGPEGRAGGAHDRGAHDRRAGGDRGLVRRSPAGVVGRRRELS
jgi:signal transduction histidine kinase